jgi:hypothetical protein
MTKFQFSKQCIETENASGVETKLIHRPEDLEAAMHRLRVSTLKALVEAHRLHSEALLAELNNAKEEEKMKSAEQLERSIRSQNTALCLLEMFERERNTSSPQGEASRGVVVEIRSSRR